MMKSNENSNLPQLISDLEEISQMLSDTVTQLKRFSAIDLSGLAALFGQVITPEVQPIKATPKGPKPPRQSGRPLSSAEKSQIQLLWQQSNQKKPEQFKRLADLYKTTPYHIGRILFPPRKKASASTILTNA